MSSPTIHTRTPIETIWCADPFYAPQLRAMFRAGPMQRASQSQQSPLGSPAIKVSNLNGVTVMECIGVFTKYETFAGNPDTASLSAAITAAATDSSVKGILLKIDSPGSGQSGVPSLADQIFKVRQSGKPIVVQVDGTLAGGSYHFASQATKLFASHKTDRIGSIGSIWIAEDSSQAAAKSGIDVHVETTGELKALGVPGVKITDQVKQYMRATVEQSQAIFTSNILRARTITAAQLATVNDGRTVTAFQARSIGLIDDIQSFDVTLAMLQAGKITASPDRVPSSSSPSRSPSRSPSLSPSLPIPQKKVPAMPTKTATQQFQEGVDTLIKSGLSREKAVTQFVHQNPATHKAMLNEAQQRANAAK